MARRAYDDVEVGAEIPGRTFQVTRLDLVMYCGGSGDFNTIHWNERFAKSVGLPDVISHGMLTMAKAVIPVTDWAGDPTAVVEYSVRFSSPVVVPDTDEGTMLEVSATVEEKLEDKRVLVAIQARSADSGVLSKARAVVQLA
jgi:acyl dehydratase